MRIYVIMGFIQLDSDVIVNACGANWKLTVNAVPRRYLMRHTALHHPAYKVQRLRT